MKIESKDWNKIDEVKGLLENEIFQNFNPSDRREITFEELAEVLVDLSYILNGNQDYATNNYDTIKFLGLLEKLGIFNEHQRRYLQQLKILKEDWITGKIREYYRNLHVFTDKCEDLCNNMSDLDFIENQLTPYSVMKSDLFERFEFELVDPKETI